MIIIKLNNEILTICKSFGIKDISKLTRKQIVDKNGHTRIVYVNNKKDKILNFNSNKELIESDEKNNGKHGVKSIIKSFSIYRKNSENSFYILNNCHKYLPANFRIYYVNKEGNCEFNPNEKSIKIIKCDARDKHLLSIAYHELFHAIDYFLEGNNTFTRYFEDVITENPVTELPEELKIININFENKLNEAMTNVHPYLYKLKEISREDFYKLPEIREATKDFRNLKKKINKKGIDLLTNLFNALNINSDNEEIILCSPHEKGYFENVSIRINEVMADYCAISLLFPKLKEKINIYKPGLADNLDRVIRLMKEEMEKKWKKN